ncbi:MAG TPA: hypothetical protein VJJ77_12260 [Dongiaceae bacterium]|nr:hypothetical protein [Dongiaceae bacterium]
MWKSALLFAALCLPVTAIAAPPMSCSPRTDVLSQLAQKFKEAPVAVGLANNGGLLEVLTNGTGSTWTIIITMPNGVSCLVAAGEDWQPTEHAALDEPLI